MTPSSRLLLCGLLLAVCAPLGDAQTGGAAWRNRILGVYDAQTGDPIEGAEVMDLSSGTSALTTKTGTVSLGFLPDGGGIVRVRKVGYAPSVRFVAISLSDTVPVTLLLTPAATSLPAVTVTDSATRHLSPGLSAFEERRATGIGQFITERELRKSDARSMTDVLRSVSGVDVRCNRGNSVCFATSTRTSGCRMVMYIDGIVVNDADLTKLHVTEFAGIEIYTGPSTVPAQYNKTGSACGVALLWSRDR